LVDELRGAPRVLDGAAAAPPGHVQRASRKTKVLLLVDEQEVHAPRVGGRGRDLVRAPPFRGCVEESLRIGREGPIGGGLRGVKRRQRQHGGEDSASNAPRISSPRPRSAPAARSAAAAAGTSRTP